MIETIHVWGATGIGPTGPNKDLRLLFGYEPVELQVHLAVQHKLGYRIFVADKFPLFETLPVATPLPPEAQAQNASEGPCPTLQYILSENLEVQMPGVHSRIIPAGSTVVVRCHHELLYSPADEE